jgi:uncharacterized protein YbaP (TraB family)
MFALGILLGKTLKAQAVQQKPGIFYSITGNGLEDTSYLFGTYHLIKSSYLNETPNVLKAFDKVKGVITEIVMDSTALARANTKGLLKEKKLTDFFDKSFADTLDATLKKELGAGLRQISNLKPMTVMLTMSMVYLIKENQELLNKYSGETLDVSFVEKGKSAGKTITPLETIEEQMDLLFDGITDEEQASALKTFIRNKEEIIKMGNNLLKTYFSNDLNAIQTVYEESLKLTGQKEYLVNQRNANWMKVLPSLMKEQSRFIAVGALHLSGPDGLVEKLKQQGYTVTALKL